jgi:SAM-dependent methyltransferase
MLDVGCGTGVIGRQLQAMGCQVLGVDPDARMAEIARQSGLPVEVATFEAWDPAGRTFDAVVAAQSWHWVDQVAGTAKAAQVLRPRGLLAIVGHVFEPPPEIAQAFADAYRRAVPDAPFRLPTDRPSGESYRMLYDGFAQKIRDDGRFGEPEAWRFDWTRPYSRDEWLDLLTTTGGLTSLAPAQRDEVAAAVGSVIDALGGGFVMGYVTLGVAAVRAD